MRTIVSTMYTAYCTYKLNKLINANKTEVGICLDKV